MDISKVLMFLRPGEEWLMNGEEYAGLVWFSDTKPPTLAEIRQAWPLVQQAEQDKAEQEQRARDAAIAHAKSLGFTDEMIAVMYPSLGATDA